MLKASSSRSDTNSERYIPRTTSPAKQALRENWETLKIESYIMTKSRPNRVRGYYHEGM